MGVWLEGVWRGQSPACTGGGPRGGLLGCPDFGPAPPGASSSGPLPIPQGCHEEPTSETFQGGREN